MKLKEISYIHSEAYASGELKHGTISLIEPGTLVIALGTYGAGVWFWLQSRLDETQQAHQAVYARVSDHDGGCGSGHTDRDRGRLGHREL